MTSKIIAILRPFELEQTIYIYDGQGNVNSLTTEIETISQTLLQLTELHSIQIIDLVGPRQFTQGLKDTLKNLEITKYQQNQIVINLI